MTNSVFDCLAQVIAPGDLTTDIWEKVEEGDNAEQPRLDFPIGKHKKECPEGYWNTSYRKNANQSLRAWPPTADARR